MLITKMKNPAHNSQRKEYITDTGSNYNGKKINPASKKVTFADTRNTEKIDPLTQKKINKYRLAVEDMMNDHNYSNHQIIDTIKKANQDIHWAIPHDQFIASIKPILKNDKNLYKLFKEQLPDPISFNKYETEVINKYYDGDCDLYLIDLNNTRITVPDPLEGDDDTFREYCKLVGCLLLTHAEKNGLDLWELLQDKTEKEVEETLIKKSTDDDTRPLYRSCLEKLLKLTALTGIFYFVDKQCTFFNFNEDPGELKYPEEKNMSMKERAKRANVRWDKMEKR